MAPMLTAEVADETKPLIPPPEPTKDAKTAKAEKGEEEGDDEEKAEKGTNVSPTLLKLKNAAEMETKAWLDAISGETAIRVRLLRKEPKQHRDPETQDMVKVDGTIQVFDRTVDEEEIQKLHGGGTFQIVVQTKNAKGQWAFFGAKTFEIAGDPNIRGIPRTHTPPKNEPTVVMPQKDPTEGKLLDKTFGFMMDELGRARHQPPQQISTGIDPATMQAMIKPLEIQIAALNELLKQKDAEIARVRETAGKDPFRDKMLDTLMDGDSARVRALNENHASEIRQLKEGFRQDLERERDRHQRDVERMEKAHERELSAIKGSNDQAIEMAKQKGDVTKMVLEGQNKQLEKQVERLETEIATLRAKKEQSIKEKVDELQAIKDLVGDDDEEEASTIEKVIGAIGNIPAVVKMAERASGGGQAPAQQQAQPQAPKRQIVRNKETGEVSLRTETGQLLPLKKAPVSVTTGEGKQVEIPSIDPEQVKQAVGYMESAFRSNTDAATFAATARPFISDTMLGAIRTLGITEFLVKVGKIDGVSVLSTMRGRQWTKKVAAALLGDDDAPPAADPAPDVPQEASTP